MEINNGNNINNTINNKNIANNSSNNEATTPYIKPYMGNLTSSQIGNMARAGALGGEMVKRMIQSEEEKLMNSDNSDKPLH